MNKASGGDGIPVELFQIPKDVAVKVLHSICHVNKDLVKMSYRSRCLFLSSNKVLKIPMLGLAF